MSLPSSSSRATVAPTHDDGGYWTTSPASSDLRVEAWPRTRCSEARATGSWRHDVKAGGVWRHGGEHNMDTSGLDLAGACSGGDGRDPSDELEAGAGCGAQRLPGQHLLAVLTSAAVQPDEDLCANDEELDAMLLRCGSLSS
ncbi:unnamed protein product [Urochloa humidicola]